MFKKILLPLALISIEFLVPTTSFTSAQSASTFFASADVADIQTIVTHSNGDLWPSCWADDDNLYATNGDGKGFYLTGSKGDVVVNRISGSIDNLSGVALAKADQVASIWGPNQQNYNRKPTGMVCVNGALYLAVQNLSKVRDALSGKAFEDAPSASISQSTDHGVTWNWDSTAPMFDSYKFTTIFFLDFGKNSADAIDNYIYAYGLDYNWRQSDGTVPNPVDVYLARVTSTNIQKRASWQFYAGLDANAIPRWTPNMDERTAVLHDERRSGHDGTVISQGGVVYDKPLNRFIYSSWAGDAFYLYEAPKPWGPWDLFLTKTFANTTSSYGGYATTIPSKFISADGQTMWLQSNMCIPCGATEGNYAFSLRKLVVVPIRATIQPEATIATMTPDMAD